MLRHVWLNWHRNPPRPLEWGAVCGYHHRLVHHHVDVAPSSSSALCPPSSFPSALSTRPLSVASPSSSSRPLLPSFLRPLFLLRLGWLPPLLSLPPSSSLPSPLVPLASPPYFVFPPSLLGSFPLKFCVASSLLGPLAFPASAAASRWTPPFTAPPLLVCRSAAAEE